MGPNYPVVSLQVGTTNRGAHLGLYARQQSARIVEVAAVDLQPEAGGARHTQFFGDCHDPHGPPHQAVADEVAPTVGTDHDLSRGWLWQQRPARDGGQATVCAAVAARLAIQHDAAAGCPTVRTPTQVSHQTAVRVPLMKRSAFAAGMMPPGTRS